MVVATVRRAATFEPGRIATAVVLASVAGYVNACVLLVAGVMVSHVTGSFTHAATDAARVATYPTGRSLLVFGGVVLFFLLGAMTSAIVTGHSTRAGYRRHARRTARTLSLNRPGRFRAALLLEALLLSIAATAQAWVMTSATATLAWHLCVFAAAMAMGVQNATLTRASGAVVRTTHLTGMTTDLGIALADILLDQRFRQKLHASLHRPTRRRRLWLRRRKSPPARRAGLFLGVAASFALGAVGGALAFAVLPRHALWPATLGLLMAAWVSGRSSQSPASARV